MREKKGGFNFKAISGETTWRDGETLSPGQLADALIDMVMVAGTSSRHLFTIDGLDKAITENQSYWLTIAALIRVTAVLNRLSVSSGRATVFVMLMCRSDVFRQVRIADAPKIAADGGLHVNWHAEASNARDVLLWDYLAKAEVDKDELLAFLPTSVSVGQQGGGVEALRYLLDFTRYTPRDISLLFKSLQETSSGSTLTGGEVRNACDNFASQHLLAEIIAEAVGLLPNRVVERLESILGSFTKRVITRGDLSQAVEDQGLADVITERALGEYLFLQGAIGNYKPEAGYIQFFHRRDAAKYQASGPWVLHTGLVYALNVPWSGL